LVQNYPKIQDKGEEDKDKDFGRKELKVRRSGVFRNWIRGWTYKRGLRNGSPSAGFRGRAPVGVMEQNPRS